MSGNQDREQIAAPPASPWAEEAGRHEGQEGETSEAATGLPGGRIAEERPSLYEIAKQQGTLMPPEGEEAEMPGREVRLTGAVAKPTESPEDARKAR